MLNDLQNEVNQLLFLYFTTIGFKENVLPELLKNITECKQRIDEILEIKPCMDNENYENTKFYVDIRETVNKAKCFVNDGLEFLNKIL
ncbi:hypothetical protein CWI38_0962p0020 [Hamiltosporidium tvaerminnensis]|uniref:Uncharacterized protein n=1 Tax=Hamiltosporidium tvaerminnensis TaxID=1176355 RepID=A0A4Q9LTL6_9MICR|nr:hypothetical protein CWI38_0962p0020 [Hamiltosporidium tvaerminnensis]